MKTTVKILGALATLLLLASPAAQAIPFGADVRVTNLPGIGISPKIAGYAGKLHIVWTEFPGGGADPETYYTCSPDSGLTFKAPVNLSNQPGRPDYYPNLTAGANGVFVFWNTDVDTGDLLMRRNADTTCGAGYANFAAELALSNNGGFYARSATAITDSGGCQHVVWYDNRFQPGLNAGDLVHRMTCNGTTWSNESQITFADGQVDSEQPRLAEDSNGNLLLIFRTTRAGDPQGGWPPFTQFIYRSQSIVRGGSPSVTWRYPAFRVTPTVPDEFTSTYKGNIAGGASGRAHAVWWDMRNGPNVVYRRGFANGAGWGASQNLSNFGAAHPQHYGVTVEGTEPAVTEDTFGTPRVHVFYTQNDSVFQAFQVGRLWYRESADSGTTFSGAVQLTSGTQTMTPAATTHNGRVHVVWADYRDNNTGPEIYYKGANVTGVADNDDSDADGVPYIVELAEGLNPGVKDNDIFAATQKGARLFGMQQYRDFLGREGDPGGISFYESNIFSGALSRPQTIENFFNSAEFSGVVAPVTRLYFAFFNRIPDYAGLQFQVNALRTGTPLTVIANNFAASPEFIATYGSLNNTQYVTLLYQNVLGRTATQPEIDFHVARLNSGVTRGEVMVGFSESPEYISLKFNAVYVTNMYVGMLHRSPEQSGFDFWVAYMAGGNSGQALIQGFINSTEYHLRFLP